MDVSELRPKDFGEMDGLTREQITALLAAVEKKSGTLDPDAARNVSTVVEQMRTRRVQLDPDGQILLSSFHSQTGAVLPGVSEATKSAIRDVANLLGVQAVHMNPTTRRIEKV